MQNKRSRNKLTAITLFGVVIGMLGLAFSSVPIYKLFCQVTGFGGTPNINIKKEHVIRSNNVINVRFDSNINAKLPWVFKPEIRELSVILGKPKLAFYTAKNLSGVAVTGTATYNVAPFKVAKYFSKIDCFCFSEQTLKPGEKIPMPVEFFIDPEILNDPNTREVKTITVSYTFFPVRKQVTDENFEVVINYVDKKKKRRLSQDNLGQNF